MSTEFKRKERAQGMVEFALVLPLLLLVMFAIIEFGRVIFTWSAVFTASREAARFGAAAGSPGNYVPYYRDCAGMQAAARRISNLAGVSTVTITYDHGDGVPVGSCPSNIPDVISLGDRVRVLVSTTYQPILPLVRIPPIPISSSAARTILKDIAISGTPSAPMGSVSVCFDDTDFATAVNEGDGDVVVGVRLSALFSEDILVPFSITGGTATLGADYTVATASPILLRSGATLVEIHLTVHQDTLDEEDEETVFISLGDPTNANRCTDVYEVKITDDDDPPSVTFTSSGQAINELNTGSSTTAQITAQLSEVSGRNVSVPFSANPTNTTAAVGLDYVFDTTSPLVIPAGALTNIINVRVNGDDMDEDDETVQVVMGTPVNATLGAITDHTVNIIDDDLPPFVRFTWEQQEVAEDVGNVGIQVQLSTASGKVISVPYGLAGSATQGQDYSILASPLVITPGLTTTNIPVSIYMDELVEPDETITVTMGTPSNAYLGSPSVHTVLVRSEIEPPTVFFVPIYQETAEADGATLTVLAQLSNAYYKDVTVPFIIEGLAQLGIDYQITASPVTIRAGSASAPIQITIVNDMIDEVNEDIKLTIGTPTNATVGNPNVHETLIMDDDDSPRVYFAAPTSSGNEEVGTIPVTVRLSNIAGVDVMVPFTVSGSATQDSDYTLSPTAMVTIPAGYLDRTININVSNDDQPNGTNVGEPAETIILTLGTPLNAVADPANSTHIATITAWVCPTAPSAPYFESGDSKRLNWQLGFSGTRTLNLAQVTVSWPTNSGTQLTGISFGSAIGASTYYPNNSGNLTVNTPSPLWSGTFATRQMVFLFNKTPDLLNGSISVTARFQHCTAITGNISN